MRAIGVELANSPEARSVTFDIIPDRFESLTRHPIIRAYHLDAVSELAFDACDAEFGEAKADFAYIDAAHDFRTTLQSSPSCSGALGAGIVMLDDITLSSEAGKLWQLLHRRYPGYIIDATNVHPEIRIGESDIGPGFGVVQTRATCD